MILPLSPSQNGANQANQVETQTKAAFSAWLNMQRPMVEAMTEINSNWIENLSKANAELLGFFSRRIEEDMAASRRFMACRSVQDVVETYSDVVQRAQQQYQSEFQYFARLNQSMAAESADAMRAHLKENGRNLAH